MKKLLAIAIALCMILSLAACGGNTNGGSNNAAPAAGNETPATNNVAEETFEWKPSAINFIVPAKAGGGTDLNARLVAKYLTAELGFPVNIVNVGGAAGATGCQEALNSAADGTNFLYYDDNIVCNYALGAVDFNYDSFDPVARIFEIPFYLVSSPKYKSIADLKADAQANPNTVVFGGEAGAFIGMLPHVMNNKLDCQLKIVDGGQMAERLPLIISNQIALTFAPMSQVRDYYEKGDLNLICTFGTERVSEFPDIQTATEQGMDIVYQRFQGVLAVKGTDARIIEKLSEAMNKISQDPKFQEEAKGISVYVSYGTTQEFTDQFAAFTKAAQEYVGYIK